MHALIGLGVLAGLMMFAFGERVARGFVAAVLAFGLFAVLALGGLIFMRVVMGVI